MVYITQSNAKRILKDMDTYPFRKDVLKIKFIQLNFLSKWEKESLAAYLCLCQDPKRFAEVYRVLDKRVNYDAVFTGGVSCYHSKKDCTRLTAPYFNIDIPKSIFDQGIDAQKEFRKWVKDNQELYHSNIEQFNKLLKEKYGIRKLTEVKIENTGVYSIENLSAEELLAKCQEIRNSYLEWKNSSKKNTAVMDAYKGKLYLAKKEDPLPEKIEGVSDKVAKKILLKCDTDFKKPFIHYLQEYYRIKYNPDLVFDKKVLDQLGFKPCSECCKNAIEDNKQKTKTDSAVKKEQEGNSISPVDKKRKQSETKNAKSPTSSVSHGINPNSKTITESVALYKQYKSIEKIAEIRNLAPPTIINHLFISGELNPDDYITEEKYSKALDILSNKVEGEQIGPKLDEFLSTIEKAAFYYNLRKSNSST